MVSHNKPEFRSDINGMRAWAVAAVILFHFSIPGFAGGYVGVDIFFVISGFLMTSIILRALSNGATEHPIDFLLKFYVSRGKRILPALLALCTILLVLGSFLLSVTEFSALGDQAASAVLFFSNVKFYNETGYFSSNAHQIWLLHTWSLSVEWQFYIALPLGMMAVWKFKPNHRALAILVAIGGLASLVLCLYVAQHNPSTSFFLLPTRAWEMIAGGLVTFAPMRPQTPWTRTALELTGFTLICTSILGFGHLVWPDWHAIVPVGGTALILLAARNDSVLTNWAPLQWLGSRSYSMYLWHWPVVVGLYYAEQQNHASAILAGLVLTVFVGHMSYTLVETKVRQPLELLSHIKVFAILTLASCTVAICGRVISAEHGFAGRLSPAVNKMFAATRDFEIASKDCQILSNGDDRGCMKGGPKLGIIVLGDSHGAAMFGAVAKSLPDPNLGAVKWTLAGCPSIPGVKKVSPPSLDCERLISWAMQRLSEIPSDVPIVIINRMPLYMEGRNELTEEDINVPSEYFTVPHRNRSAAFYLEMQQRMVAGACAMAKQRTVYMLRPTPEMQTNVPVTLGRAMLVGRKREISVSLEDYQTRTATTKAAQDSARDKCGVKILDPVPYLCHGSHCSATDKGRALYYDDNHLSTYGSSKLIPLFAEMFKMPPKS